MTPNVVDMFHGDNRERMPDFSALKAEGILAIIHKCSQGSNGVDELCEARIQAARDAGLLVATYHFGDGSDVDKQLDNMEKHSPVPFMWLDFERNPRSQMSPLQARQFLQSMHIPAIYGSDLLRSNALMLGKAMASLDDNAQQIMPWLWLAEYGPHERIPLPWNADSTLLWQFSESGSFKFINGHVDLNVFNGTAEQLTTKWGKPCLIA